MLALAGALDGAHSRTTVMDSFGDVSVQQAEPPAFLSYWKEIAATVAVWSVVLGFAVVAVFDRIFIRSFERNKRELKGIHAEWYAPEIAEVEVVTDMVHAHEDSIKGLSQAQILQGSALRSVLDEHLGAITRTQGDITTTLQAIQIEAGKTSTALGFISKDVEDIKRRSSDRGESSDRREWDGVDRRGGRGR
jgi:hypothetical protein